MEVTDRAAPEKTDPPAVWGVLELMGHYKVGGRLSEEEKYGCKLGRIDIPQEDGSFVTQFFGGASVYRLTVTTEAVARVAARGRQHEPVAAWDFPKALPARPPHGGYPDPDDGTDPDDYPL